MSAYANPVIGKGTVALLSNGRTTGRCSQRLHPTLTGTFLNHHRAFASGHIPNSSPSRQAQNVFEIHCDSSEPVVTHSSLTSVDSDWKQSICAGSVLEVWSKGELRFAHVDSLYEKGVFARFVDISSGESSCGSEVKVSYGEIITVWNEDLEPKGPQPCLQLARDVDNGLQYLKNLPPRTLDLTDFYNSLNGFQKNDPRAVCSSVQASNAIFPMNTVGTRKRRAAITVATAILLAADNIRFKRAGPGKGWKALPMSVVVARGRCSFVDSCKKILEHRSSGSLKRIPSWAREHLEILRQLEIYAASGTIARGTAATALEALGYEPTDDGAARLLLDIEYWATGSVESDGGGTTLATDPVYSDSWHKKEDQVSDLEAKEMSTSSKNAERRTQWEKANSIRDWTFPPEILADARELRNESRRRRQTFLDPKIYLPGRQRRNLIRPQNGEQVAVYCIDDKNSRFLDDAFSVQLIDDEPIIRITGHITDVDQVVRSGSAIDKLARERGQSLYLPLKPLHMLPATVMDAASFSSSMPTEAISVMIDYDYDDDSIRNWEVFASVVPPVRRLNYDQFDLALEQGAKAAQIKEKECEDLRRIAEMAPLLADKLDRRRVRRRHRANLTETYGCDDSYFDTQDSRGIASVRLVKRPNRSTKGTMKVAQVVDFRLSGSYSAVGDMLTSVGALLRQFAKENRAFLPEDRGASSYVARCGTAPMRRYADLATQRQIKCVLFGRQPAGRRRMEELRIWLARRQSAGERTVSERRRSALFDSLAAHCAQQATTTNVLYATMNGRVRSCTVTKRNILKVEVSLDGTGLSTFATVSGKLLTAITKMTSYKKGSGSSEEESCNETRTRNEELLICARQILPSRSKVKVQVVDVDTAAQRIQANVVSVIE